MSRAASVSPPGAGGTPLPARTPKQERDERRYHQLVQQLRDLAKNEKATSASAAKKVVGALEELVSVLHLAEPSIASLVVGLAKFEKGVSDGLQNYINVVAWAALTQGIPSSQDFTGITTMATQGMTSDSYEHKRTSLLALLMLSMIQQNSSTLALQLHKGYVADMTSVLKKSLDVKTGEKRGFTSKAAWHEGKKTRLLAHLAALRMFGLTFVTHIYPHWQMQNQAGQAGAVAELLVNTAVEYSFKAKEVPVVRECLQALTCIAQVAPNDVRVVIPYLPLDMEKVAALTPLKKDDKAKKKTTPYLTCWDPATAGNLVRLCLAVVHHLDDRAALGSPFMQCLFVLFHHPRYAVFADALFGVLKRSGLFYVLIQPDQVYRSQELLLVYAVNRIHSMVSGTCQVTCNAGLRLTIAIVEQILNHLTDHTAEISTALPALRDLEAAVAACLERYARDPLLCTNGLRSLVWLTAVNVAQCHEQRSVSKPMQVRQLLHALIHTTGSSPLQESHTFDILKVLNRAMKALPPDDARPLMIPAFTGMLAYLLQRCVHKISAHNLYGVLEEFLINVDVVSRTAAPAAAGVVAPLDIDAVPQQRNHGGTHTLRLVAGMLDGEVSHEVAAAEQMLSLAADAQEGRQVRKSRMIIELVRFTGDFGNIMVNGKGWGDPASNMTLLLVRLQTLLHTMPHHIVWEAALAVLKLSSRSLTSVRVKAYMMLTEVATVRPGLATLLAPLIKILDDCLHLHEAYDNMMQAVQQNDTMTDIDLAAEGFVGQHELLKERLSVFTRFVELKRMRLLGAVSEPLLKRGEARRTHMQAAPQGGQRSGGMDILFSPV